MSHGQPRHYGDLCELEHWCPNCEDGTGPCTDLFEHPICGLVACAVIAGDVVGLEGASEATGADLRAPGAQSGHEDARPSEGHTEAETEAESVIARNRRVFEHEATTPMRGHDSDGRCCRQALEEA